MPQIAHYHDFAATNNGYRCTLQNCTATLTNAQIATNLPAAGKNVTMSDMLNHASKKAGNS